MCHKHAGDPADGLATVCPVEVERVPRTSDGVDDPSVWCCRNSSGKPLGGWRCPLNAATRVTDRSGARSRVRNPQAGDVNCPDPKALTRALLPGDPRAAGGPISWLRVVMETSVHEYLYPLRSARPGRGDGCETGISKSGVADLCRTRRDRRVHPRSGISSLRCLGATYLTCATVLAGSGRWPSCQRHHDDGSRGSQPRRQRQRDETGSLTSLKGAASVVSRLAISDQHAGLVKALKRCFQGTRANCRVHRASARPRAQDRGRHDA